MRVAADREDRRDARAVRRPRRSGRDGRWRQESDAEVVVLGDAARAVAVGGDEPWAHHRIADPGRRLVQRVERDRLAVGRPRRRQRAAHAACDLLRAGAVGVPDHQVALVVVTLAAAVAHPRDALPIGRPRLGAVVEVAVGELFDRAARDVDDEEVRARVEGVALAVGLVLRAIDVPRSLLPGLALLGVRRRLRVRHARDEQQTRRVGRPRRRHRAEREVGEAARLATGHGHDVKLRLVALAIREEREPLAVRREARRRVLLLVHGSETLRLAARRVGGPHAGDVAVDLGVDLAHGERDA